MIPLTSLYWKKMDIYTPKSFFYEQNDKRHSLLGQSNRQLAGMVAHMEKH